ncbi:pyridoxamine 5'-phosphate oxidase family protein [Senegalimassilia sp.]
MDLQNIPAIYPDAAGQAPAPQPQQPAAAQAAPAAAAPQAAPAAPVAHRPMRQAGRQLRSAGQLHDVVEACQTVRIACADEEGLFIVPMSFGYDWADPEEIDADEPRLALWVHSAGAGRKADAFDREPRVAIEMDVQDGVIAGTYACAYSYAYRSIMGTGTIHRIQGTDAKRYGLTRIMQHLAPEASAGFTDQALARTNIYCIDIDHFTGKQRA